MADDYFGGQMVNRQLLLWAIATRQQLERWEPLVAASLRAHIGGPAFGDALIWKAEIEHHFLLIAARNLIRAIDLPGTDIAMHQTVRAELIEGRDLIEHWQENVPIFLVSPRREEPKHRSGRNFGERNPDRDPYSWLGWSSDAGPRVLPHVPAEAIHDLVDRVVATVLASDPGLERFVPERESSPWLGAGAGKDRWWPRGPDGDLPKSQ